MLAKYSMAPPTRSCAPFRGPEVSDQAGEGVLIYAVVLPPSEVPDVPRQPDMRGPSDRGFQDRVVEPDREEHGSSLPPLPLKGGFDFPLHPIAREGMLREHEHELVVNPDRLADAMAELVADL